MLNQQLYNMNFTLKQLLDLNGLLSMPLVNEKTHILFQCSAKSDASPKHGSAQRSCGPQEHWDWPPKRLWTLRHCHRPDLPQASYCSAISPAGIDPWACWMDQNHAFPEASLGLHQNHLFFWGWVLPACSGSATSTTAFFMKCVWCFCSNCLARSRDQGNHGDLFKLSEHDWAFGIPPSILFLEAGWAHCAGLCCNRFIQILLGNVAVLWQDAVRRAWTMGQTHSLESSSKWMVLPWKDYIRIPDRWFSLHFHDNSRECNPEVLANGFILLFLPTRREYFKKCKRTWHSSLSPRSSKIASAGLRSGPEKEMLNPLSTHKRTQTIHVRNSYNKYLYIRRGHPKGSMSVWEEQGRY